MTTFYRIGLCLLALFTCIVAVCQQIPSSTPISGGSTIKVTIPSEQQAHPATPMSAASDGVVVLSATATTARIADPNEPVVFSGHVMRMADFVAAVSSSSATEQRPHTPETHNHEKVPPVPQS